MILIFDSTVFCLLAKANPVFVGDFEKDTSEEKTTKWDSVRVSYDVKLGIYKWKNKAGRSWTLYPSAQGDELKVGTDSPYYQENGHLIVKFTVNGLYGPGDEFYKRKGLLVFDAISQLFRTRIKCSNKA